MANMDRSCDFPNMELPNKEILMAYVSIFWKINISNFLFWMTEFPKKEIFDCLYKHLLGARF